MWPGTWGDGQGLEQTNGGTVRDLVLGTNWASQHKLPDILANGGPPKSLADGSQRPPDSWMAGNPGFMTPLKDLRAQRLRHEQPTRRTLNWHFYPSPGPFHTLLDVPGESPYHNSFLEYGISRGLFSWALELAGKCIGLNIFGPGPVRKGEVETIKEECPASLARAQPLGWMDIFLWLRDQSTWGLCWPNQGCPRTRLALGD